MLPANWSRGKSVDIIGDAAPKRYGDALDALLPKLKADALLVINCPTALASSSDAAQAVIEAIKRAPNAERLPPILTNWLGEDAAAGGRRLFREASIPTYESPTDAVKGFLLSMAAHKGAGSDAANPAAGDGADACRRGGGAHGHAQCRRRRTLDADRARGQGSALRLRHPDGRHPRGDFAARGGAIAAGLLQQAPALAVKILSKDISHKSDVGGVRLGLRSAQDAVRAAEQMLKRVSELKPDARIEGFTVQPMVTRPNAHELLLGIYEDPLFGPMILFGAGGTATESSMIRPWRCRRSMTSWRAISWSRRASTSCSKAIATGRPPTSRRSPRRCGGCRSLSSIARRSRSSTSTRCLRTRPA